jgi:ATP-binding cassette subfamily B protein
MFHSGMGGWWQYLSAEDSKDTNIDRHLLKRVWQYARPYRSRIIIILVAISLSVTLGLLPPLIYRRLIDNTLPTKNYIELNLLALAMIAVPLISGIIEVAQRFQSSTVGEGLIRDLRQSLYNHMQHMSLRFFTNTKTGEIMARLNNDVVGAQRAVTGTLISIITNATRVLFTLSIMLSLNWRLAIISIAILPLFLVPARKVANRLRDITRTSFELNAQMNVLMNETLNVSGALLMKLFGRQADTYKEFKNRSNAVADIGVRSAVVGSWFFMALGTISATGTALVFWYGGHLVLTGAFSIGTIIAFAAYLRNLYGPISSLVNARVDFTTSMVSFERVFEVVDLPIEITDTPTAIHLNNPEGRINFNNVYFSYTSLTDQDTLNSHTQLTSIDRPYSRRQDIYATSTPPTTHHKPDEIQTWTLQNIEFTIKPGQLAALVGPSGAGKTTLTYLLPRLYDPNLGSIEIDGIDLRQIRLKSLSKLIGMVTQETYLFHDTLEANLRYANPQATNQEISKACLTSNLTDFIDDLPDGLDTIVGERGYKLSGGEKQRVSIARVILKDPRILILDEATSSLDSRSEALIQSALKPLFVDRTSLVIAHRLSTILASDIIIVIDNGCVVEQGSHQDLLSANGLYAELYNTQFQSQRDIV